MNILTRSANVGGRPRVVVTDGQGVTADYPLTAANAEENQEQHFAAGRQFLAEQKGVQADVQLVAQRSDGWYGFLLAPFQPEPVVADVGIEVDTETGNLILGLGDQRFELATTATLRQRLAEAIERSAHYDPEA